MTDGIVLRAVVLGGALSMSSIALAGRPLNMNDTEPVEAGKWQIEAGGAYRHDSGWWG